MKKIDLKLGKVLKIVTIVLLIGIGTVSLVQVGNAHDRAKSSISCKGDSDTIIIVQERSRGREFIDILKKVMFSINWIPSASIDFLVANSTELKSLLVNRYQRNVFYVYSFSTVP